MKNILFYNIGLIPEKLVLPYNWACLKTYAELDNEIVQNYNWLDPITHGNGIKQIVENYDITNLDVLGLSCFAWTEEELNNVAILVKSINPKCLVVIGGAQPDYSDIEYFNKHPYIDIIVKNEGEYAFYKILKELNNKKNYKNVPGIIITYEGNYMDTGNTVLIDNTELSPYIEQQEYFDRLINNYEPSKEILNYESIVVPWETTRGCPYNCTYCKWDFSIDNKKNTMRKVSDERIKKEINWFNTIEKSWMLMGIDSNFGFFDRDVNIAEYLCDHLNQEYFKLLYLSRGRNVQNSNLIQTMLYENGLIRTNPIGIQHTDPDVIKAMNRVPIDYTKILNNVPSVVHVILGSPEDNLNKWKLCLTDILEHYGQGCEFMVYKYSIFNNTNSSTPEFIKKYNIETINRLPQSYLKVKTDNFKFSFSNKFVVSTNTFDREEWVKMYMFTIIIHSFFTSSILTYITQYLKREYDISLLTIYSALFDYILNTKNSFMNDIMNKCKDCLDEYSTKDFTNSNMEVEEIKDSIRMLKTEEYFLFKMLYYSEDYIKDINSFFIDFYKQNISNINISKFQDLLNYQNNSLVTYDYNCDEGREFYSEYDWIEYFKNEKDIRLYQNKFKITTKNIGTNSRPLYWSDESIEVSADKFIEVVIGSTYNRSNRGFLKDIIKNV